VASPTHGVTHGSAGVVPVTDIITHVVAVVTDLLDAHGQSWGYQQQNHHDGCHGNQHTGNQ